MSVIQTHSHCPIAQCYISKSGIPKFPCYGPGPACGERINHLLQYFSDCSFIRGAQPAGTLISTLGQATFLPSYHEEREQIHFIVLKLHSLAFNCPGEVQRILLFLSCLLSSVTHSLIQSRLEKVT